MYDELEKLIKKKVLQSILINGNHFRIHICPKRFTWKTVCSNHLHRIKSFPLSFEPFGKLRAG